MSKAENGRLGDFAEITNNAIGTNFVAENGFIGDHKMPEPEKVQGDFSQVGYRGNPNLRQNVQRGVQTTGGEVKQATGKPEEQYAKTGASPDKHFQNSTKETEAVNARNQAEQKEKGFLKIEKDLVESDSKYQYSKTGKDLETMSNMVNSPEELDKLLRNPDLTNALLGELLKYPRNEL